MQSDNKKKIIKYNILGAVIIAVAIIIIAVSSSYAFFVNKIEKLNPENQGLTITSGNLKMAFKTTNVFTDLKATLIEAASGTSDEIINRDVLKTKAGNTTFSIGVDPTSGVKNAKYDLFLTEINVSENLKNKYLKYALYEGETLKTTGSFAGYQTGNKELLSVETATTASTNYTLYVWLENDPNVIQSQECGGVYTNGCIDLREGTLSFKVGFRAVSVAQ